MESATIRDRRSTDGIIDRVRSVDDVPEFLTRRSVNMRTIDIFVSSPADVQKECAVAEQLIRSAAAEFYLPINVSYSNPLRGLKADGSARRFWSIVNLTDEDDESRVSSVPSINLVLKGVRMPSAAK